MRIRVSGSTSVTKLLPSLVSVTVSLSESTVVL